MSGFDLEACDFDEIHCGAEDVACVIRRETNPVYFDRGVEVYCFYSVEGLFEIFDIV